MQSGEYLVFTRPDQDKKTKEGKVMSVVTQLETLPPQNAAMIAFRIKSVSRENEVRLSTLLYQI